MQCAAYRTSPHAVYVVYGELRVLVEPFKGADNANKGTDNEDKGADNANKSTDNADEGY